MHLGGCQWRDIFSLQHFPCLNLTQQAVLTVAPEALVPGCLPSVSLDLRSLIVCSSFFSLLFSSIVDCRNNGIKCFAKLITSGEVFLSSLLFQMSSYHPFPFGKPQSPNSSSPACFCIAMMVFVPLRVEKMPSLQGSTSRLSFLNSTSKRSQRPSTVRVAELELLVDHPCDLSRRREVSESLRARISPTTGYLGIQCLEVSSRDPCEFDVSKSLKFFACSIAFLKSQLECFCANMIHIRKVHPMCRLLFSGTLLSPIEKLRLVEMGRSPVKWCRSKIEWAVGCLRIPFLLELDSVKVCFVL